MMSGFKSVSLVALVGALLFGCSSDDEDEDRKTCKALCNFVNECGGAAEDCSNVDTCMENLEELSGSCRSSLETFTDCWDKHPDCNSSECAEPAMKFTSECEDEV